ncbi:potassium/proton antiporter [Actinoallomurus rhizosphaericola]|uniref:potassium/proton antiporter n=1 Tax=Actinoallomurus rhizosphaericola TaxID=2952536 RepID=UPI002093ABE4|nr:potassium/proton antiporter [Actinoallomurus rhizosphaericola]MCO5996404.1 potassium/proton antiporter [Actinoallomurus rhizosphaericola]
MSGVERFGLAILLIALVGTVAVLSNRFSERTRIPAPAIFLLCAAVASDLWPRLGAVSIPTIQKVVTVALAVILFDGGMHIGRRRFRSAAGATIWIGVAGTLVTGAAVALLAHYGLGIDWRLAMLLGTALSPTDPAVVFSVLGRREIAGRTGTLLEGESGANDPVGIALLVAVLGATGGGVSAIGHVTVVFVEQMAIGGVIGVAGGMLLLAFMRRVPLPSEGLYALRVLFGALAVYGLATVAHGSGFLAVLVAGIVLGDERAPYKREIERFHSSLASLAEIVAFTMLGLTISLRGLGDGGAWWIGLVLAVALAFVIRPLFVGLLLWPVRLRRNERIFVLWTGLKGAVPILLGLFILQEGLPGARRAYEIIFVVVAFSVIVQGGSVPGLARRLRIPLRVVEPEPWSLGVRFQEEPEGLHRYQVQAGSPADGMSVDDLPCGEDVWISFVIRDGRLVPVRGDTLMRAGDEVLVLATDSPDLDAVFSRHRGGPATC